MKCLVILQIHLNDYVVEDVAQYGDIILFMATDLGNFNSTVRTYIRKKAMREGRTFEEIVKIINFIHKEADKQIYTKKSKQDCRVEQR